MACQDLFSDALYRPFFCANVPLEHYASNIPPRNQIRRLPDLSQEEYSAHWTNKPFILTEPVKQWPAYKQWTVDTLLAEYGNVSFRAEAIDWPLRTYVDYMINNTDESPLYLFDCRFAKKMAVTVGKDVPDAIYWPPHCIGEDLFALLGSHRPDSRWLIMGPARSGSTMHKDPNATRYVDNFLLHLTSAPIVAVPTTLSTLFMFDTRRCRSRQSPDNGGGGHSAYVGRFAAYLGLTIA